MTVKKISVLLLTIIFCGVMAAAVAAAPDEWIPEKGLYLDPAVSTAVDNQSSQKAGVLVNGASCTYKVASGDTLSGIALKFGVSVRDISVDNDLKDANLLTVGRRLVISGAQGSRGGLATRILPVGKLDWPVAGWISSPFGMRNGEFHEGIDIAADYGAPIKAALAGRVVFAGPRGTYGNAVIINHGGGLCTLYAHSSIILVNEGEWVSEGQIIALVGNTGRSRGPHLHLEVLINGLHYDPLICLIRANA